jgi:tripartite-type tricarboxylate transporter receptor subunit TctC
MPHVHQYAKTDDDRKLFDLIFGLQKIGRPFAAPPQIPKARAEALRNAFMATLDDRKFKAEAARLQIDLTPMNGEDVAEFVRQIYAAPPAIIARARRAVKP